MSDYPEDCGCETCRLETLENDAASKALLRGGRFPVGRLDTMTTRHLIVPGSRSTIDYLAEQHRLVMNTAKPATDREWREWRDGQTMSATEWRRYAAGSN